MSIDRLKQYSTVRNISSYFRESAKIKAKAAIVNLKLQLTTAIGKDKRLKLERKIREWEELL